METKLFCPAICASLQPLEYDPEYIKISETEPLSGMGAKAILYSIIELAMKVHGDEALAVVHDETFICNNALYVIDASNEGAALPSASVYPVYEKVEENDDCWKVRGWIGSFRITTNGNITATVWTDPNTSSEYVVYQADEDVLDDWLIWEGDFWEEDIDEIFA